MQRSASRLAQLAGMSENGYATYHARQVVKQRFPTPLFTPVLYPAHRTSYVSSLETAEAFLLWSRKVGTGEEGLGIDGH